MERFITMKHKLVFLAILTLVFTAGASAQTKQPKTVRDFFMLLTEKYFTLESCDRGDDIGCKKAKAKYLKDFTEVEDIPNGYFKGGCDGAQFCIEMAIFKRPNGKYLVGVTTRGEMMNEFHFIEYVSGRWRNASADVPGFSNRNWYDLPHVGTTVEVYVNKVVERGSDHKVTEKGKKLYDLIWKGGKFVKK